jgi:hypothetical protein
MWISLSSGLRVGFGPVNLGEWLDRLRPDDAEIVAIGWLRTATGVQSLISTILVAMWALSFFSTPFD